MRLLTTIGVLVFTTLLSSSAQSSAKPCSPLGSSACGQSIKAIARDVMGWHDVQNPSCKFERVLSAIIIESEPDATTEHWTIEACEAKQFTYSVYILRMGGGFSVMVSNLDADTP